MRSYIINIRLRRYFVKYYFACVAIIFMVFCRAMEDEFLTTKEAADRLGVSAAYIRQMIIAGTITGAKKFGRDNAVPVSEIERLEKTDRKAGRPKKNKRL